MDIKLKNRRRAGIALAVLTVVIAAAVMVGLYPYFERESARYRTPAYEKQEFLRNLVYGNYVMNLEAEKKAQGEVLSPFRVYFPEAAENFAVTLLIQEEALEESIDARNAQADYIQKLKQDCNREYDSWKRSFNSIRREVDSQMTAADGSIAYGIADRDLLESSNYVFRVAMSYDKLGNMEILTAEGENPETIKGILENLGSSDPMSNYYWEDFQYDPDLTFAGPKNATFVYAMTQEMLDSYAEGRSYSMDEYYVSEAVPRVFTGMMGAVALLALFFSCFRLIESQNTKLLRAPVEVVAAVGSLGIGFGYGLVRLVTMTNRGQLYDGLLRADFLPRAAVVMVKLWNILWWCVPFAVVYWCVLCLKDVFCIGLRRYIRERTLVGLLWGSLKGAVKKCGVFLDSIDLQEESNKIIWKIVGVNFLVLAVLCCLWFWGIGGLIVYSVLLFLILRRYYSSLHDKYKVLLNATGQIAKGNLEASIPEDLGVFEPFKAEIQKIQSGFKAAVEEEVKSQNMKTDLITNVSHDLKTPLTAIITYVNLLKEDSVPEEQRRAYVEVLEQKSMRLKALIEDLFEISKATSNNVTLNLMDVDIVSLLKEASYELSDKIEASGVAFKWNLPEEKTVLQLDSQKTYRIFDNLLNNIVKYALPNTRAYVDLRTENGYVTITMKNVSASELDYLNPEEITERFVQGDQSRNTEGSGLGLAIAKSFVELQNGRMTVELDADLFKVTIQWPLYKSVSGLENGE